jgi:hypothetical protein
MNDGHVGTPGTDNGGFLAGERIVNETNVCGVVDGISVPIFPLTGMKGIPRKPAIRALVAPKLEMSYRLRWPLLKARRIAYGALTYQFMIQAEWISVTQPAPTRISRPPTSVDDSMVVRCLFFCLMISCVRAMGTIIWNPP